MAYITRIAFRHAHSIRSQVVAALGLVFKAYRQFDLHDWLDQSAPALKEHVTDDLLKTDLYVRHGDHSSPMGQNYALLLNSAILSLDHARTSQWGRDYFIDTIRSSSGGDHRDEDYHGTHLGGDWDIPNFIIRSGIVLLLGALEEFERGTLRILTHFLPAPCLASQPTDMIVPRLQDYQRECPGYLRLDRSRRLQSVKGRHEELGRYGVSFDQASEWTTVITRLRRSRNTIAHGVAASVHPFDDFLQLNYAVYRAVDDIARQIESAHRIAL